MGLVPRNGAAGMRRAHLEEGRLGEEHMVAVLHRIAKVSRRRLGGDGAAFGFYSAHLGEYGARANLHRISSRPLFYNAGTRVIYRAVDPFCGSAGR